MAAASGMGAISSALWTSVVAGDEIVADETLYGCTYALLNHGMTKFGVKVTLTDLSDIENLKKNLTDKTRVVYFETPCNPTLKLHDIELIAKTAHAFNPDIRVIVDNTFWHTVPGSVLWSWARTWWFTAPPSTSTATAT